MLAVFWNLCICVAISPPQHKKQKMYYTMNGKINPSFVLPQTTFYNKRLHIMLHFMLPFISRGHLCRFIKRIEKSMKKCDSSCFFLFLFIFHFKMDFESANSFKAHCHLLNKSQSGSEQARIYIHH